MLDLAAALQGYNVLPGSCFVDASFKCLIWHLHCRATTCYLVQRRIDMLPKPLTEDICSLRSNVERLAFSAIWEMTQEAQVLHVRSAYTFIVE